MIDPKALLTDLKKLVTRLEDDLRERVSEHSEIDEHLRDEFRSAKEAGRTGQGYEAWRDEFLTQCAVAWILGTVFVRFLEDNELIETPRLSGPGERRQHALDQHTLFFQKHPTETDREYLRDVFGEVKKLPAAESLFDEKHNPLWTVGLSGDGATELLQFWQRVNPDTGTLDHDFTDSEWSTRFLGDLYQDLSERARKKYALLQTPEFVEEFILDRTLEPAIEEFGFQEVRLIDPACGSGHFLLGAFHRLYERRAKADPGTNSTKQAQSALDQVYGVDINPYATAITRFRLLLAALKVCGAKRLADAPGFKLNLATGDSLLHGPRPGTLGARQQYLLDEDPLKHVYQTEDADELKRILGQRYHAVVGNPPYITVKDKALNTGYRERFVSCYRQYSLVAPFLERFFDLAVPASKSVRDAAGYVGVIAGNAFMKREFGKKLIEKIIPQWDLTHIVDTEGIPVPKHGTATVILLGRSRQPTARTVRTVSCLRSDPPSIASPDTGNVWPSILRQIDRPGSHSEFVSVNDTPRATFQTHPWSLAGGGAVELKSLIDAAAETLLTDHVDAIGRTTVVGEDDAWVLDVATAKRRQIAENIVGFVVGEAVRDWTIVDYSYAIYPYERIAGAPLPTSSGVVTHYLWPYRTLLKNRTVFGKTLRDMDRPWYEHLEHYTAKLRTPLSITFAFVATHNHFVLDRGGKVFKQSAPVIKLPPNATEDDHLALLGLLNSSAACFWMKQVFYCKGMGGINEGRKEEKWERFYEHDASKLKKFPVVDAAPYDIARRLDGLARKLTANSPSYVFKATTWSPLQYQRSKAEYESKLPEMIAMQEELDWKCYSTFRISSEDLSFLEGPPAIELGERAFEIAMARKIAAGELKTRWFERHDSESITTVPIHWPPAYKEIVERRILEIETNPNIALIEKPEFKRRWNVEPWDVREKDALRTCMLERLESKEYWTAPELTTVSRLTEFLGADAAFTQMAELYRGSTDFDLTRLVWELTEQEAAPFVGILRYKASGLRKREVWEKTWALQRLEDAIAERTKLPSSHPDFLPSSDASALMTKEVGRIPVPPKYRPTDFQANYWRLRGKLDVPKERFISFPYCERAADPSPVILWAGLNHLQQAKAIASYYLEMREQVSTSTIIDGKPPISEHVRRGKGVRPLE